MLSATRRKLIGGALVGASGLAGAFGRQAAAGALARKGRILLDRMPDIPRGLVEAVNFPLIEAIHGRRSRRFARGASIPDGPLAFTSRQPAARLTETEQLLLLATVAGNTGWANLIPFNRAYLPHIPNYAAAAGGRSFPSAAGFHTTEVFYTDDDGVYLFPTRDMTPDGPPGDGGTDLAAWLAAHRARIVKLADGRLNTPREARHMEMHNAWCANVPGSTLIVPVSDLAQHQILNLCYLVQNGACIFDDINGRAVPGIERFAHLVDPENAYPLSYFDQIGVTEVTVESSTACYAGALMLQALGLGGWMYEGINPFSILGASGDRRYPGSASATTPIRAGRCPTSPGCPACSRATVRRTSPTCGPPSTPSLPASSAPAGRSTRPRPAPIARPPPCAAAVCRTMPTSAPASP
ncbi:MAG: hypothetical protein R3F55_09105 [Alphaproteobacteria bacterium]